MKKFLSLVLALVMTMSLVTVASAASFTDDASINYDEAVDVIEALDIVGGYADGSFKPTNTLTRGAAAKIICNLILTPAVADTLTATAAPYADVPADSTFAAYIAYCKQEGIINGYADGTFRPSATLTSNAFMKMLLGALGYDGAVEGYTGDNWGIQVAKKVASLKLADGDDSYVGTAAITREEACLYAFNTLNTQIVEYTSKGTTVTINGAVIATGASAAAGVEKDDTAVLFRDKYYTKLDQVDNGNGTHTWKNGTTVIGTYADHDTTGIVYTGTTTAAQLYTDGVKLADTVTAYVNGKSVGSYALNVTRGDTTTKNFTEYDGATITLLTNNDGKVDTVSVIMPYMAEVVKVYAETASKDAYTQLKVYMNSSTGTTAYIDGNDFTKGDVLLYAPSNNTLATSSAPDEDALVLEKADSFVSTVSGYNTSKATFTAAGTAYSYSDAAKKLVAIAEMDVKNGTTYVFYEDLNGTIIGSKVDTEGTSTLNYAYVSQVDATYAGANLINAGTDALKVKVTYMDGTTAVVDYALNTATTAMTGAGINGTIAKGETYFTAPNGTKYELNTTNIGQIADDTLYSYTLNAEGKITLSSTLTSTGAVPTTATLVATSGSVNVTKGSAQVKDGSNALIGYATTSTNLVLAKGDTVTTYAGYNNFPTTATYTEVNGTLEIVYVTTGTTTKTITNILVIGGQAVADTTPDNFVVYTGAGDITSEGSYYNFFVNGAVQSYLISDSTSVAAGSLSAGTIYGLTLDTDGKAVVTTATTASITVAAVTDAYIGSASAVYYVKDAYTAYDIEAADATTWTDADVEIGDTVTVVYKNDATAGVDNILAVFVTTNVVA